MARGRYGRLVCRIGLCLADDCGACGPLDAGSRDDSQRGELFLVRRISLFLRPAHGRLCGRRRVFLRAEPAFRTEDVAFRGRSGRCRPVRSGQLDRSRGIPRAVRSDGRQYGGRRHGRERGRNGRVARTQTDAQSAVRGVQRDFQHVDLRRPARFVDLDFCPASRRSVRRRNVCRRARVRVVRTKKPSARFGGGIRRRMCK